MNVVEAIRKVKGTDLGFRRAKWPPFRWAVANPQGMLIDGEKNRRGQWVNQVVFPLLMLRVDDIVAVDWEVERRYG
jgi:hypothetical protein